jgi:hypothetical protein
MKRNKKSVSVKNTKSFLGNAPALVNTTFFVPAANLNSNDGIFTDLHDYPSNFSSSNQDPNWQFDISNKIFAQSNKKKIFSDDKFMNMISKMPDVYDTYTSDLFTGDFAPVENYSDVVRAVSPVLADINYPTYQSDVDLQPVSVGIAPVDSDYFAPSMVYRDTYMNAEVIRQGQQSNSDYFNNPNVFASSNSYQTPTEIDYPRYQSDVDLQPVLVGRGYVEAQKLLRPEFLTSEMISSYSDEELIKLIGQEEFDRLVAQKYGSAVLSNTEVKPAVDPSPNTNNVPTDSIQPTTVEDGKKIKKPFNYLPLLLVVAAVGGYMYYNRKK